MVIDDFDSPTPLSSDEEDEEDEEIKGGGDDESDDDDMETDLTGLKLSNPNPFEKRLQERDPKLFLTKKEGKYNAYSRLCPSNYRRQPVILTDEEKAKIDKEHPGSYKEALRYGSSKSKQHWYICPRYWCLKNNVSLTEEDVKAGKCGGKVIPFGAKKVPKDAYIYEFKGRDVNNSPNVDKDGNYVTTYPGFTKDDSHPDGLCVPCCFKAWDSKSQEERRKECLTDSDKRKKPKVLKLNVKDDEYIKGPEKMPLEQNRWGYIPLSLEVFFGFDSNDSSRDNYKIIKYKPYILRKGVESSKNQSFIACFADSLAKDKVLSIKEMKDRIINSLSLDTFLTFHNGNLPSIFYNNDIEVDINDYRTSYLYKTVDFSNENQIKSLTNIIKAYVNFILYLKNDSIIIDHTYLWDIITSPNELLFARGINLVILEETNDDLTNDINVICPTNFYSNNSYNTNKSTVFLYKNNEYYEPIYIYINGENNETQIKKAFSEYDKNLLPNIKRAIKFIKKIYEIQCKPKRSNMVYEFKENLSSIEIIKLLKSIDYDVDMQIINYNGKVIGLMVTNQGFTGFVPTRQSNILLDIPYKYMDSDDIWSDYTSTRNFLMELSKKIKIPCKPVKKVLEDNLVVGILTETNQFVMIETPEDNTVMDELEPISDYNHIMVDSETLTSDTKDVERELYVKKIKLETNFYNVFRITIKGLLLDPENYETRKAIEEIINDKEKLYTEKLDELVFVLKKLTTNFIKFTEGYDDTIINYINDLTTCYNNPNCNDNKFCLMDDNKCLLVIPKKHLITNIDNERIYFGRLSDELLRYNFIRNFILKPQIYLSLKPVHYNLKDDEIILLEMFLTQEYFENLIPRQSNYYSKHNVFDDIQPNVHLNLSNNMSLSKKLDEELEECIMAKKRIPLSLIGKTLSTKLFNSKTMMQTYKNSEECSFRIMVDIINDFKKEKVSVNDLKAILAREYTGKFFKPYTNEIRILLETQGKRYLLQKVLQNKIRLEELIITGDYYLTELDIRILAIVYELPIVLITKGDPVTFKLLNEIRLNEIRLNEFYFIKLPSIQLNKIPKYSLLYNNDDGYRINIEPYKYLKRLITSSSAQPILEWMKDTVSYEKPKKKRKPKKLIIKS